MIGLRRFQWYQVHKYDSQMLILKNSGAEIWIDIETQDLFLQPTKSYLLVERRLQKNNETAYAESDHVSLVHNRVMFLFRSIAFRLFGQLIPQ